MNDLIEGVIPCIAVLSIFGMILGFVAYMRYLRYKETIALAEKGLLRSKPSGTNGKHMLRWGILVTCIGAGLCAGVLPIGFLMSPPIFIGPWILVGILPMSIGVGLLLIYWLTRNGDSASVSEGRHQ